MKIIQKYNNIPASDSTVETFKRTTKENVLSVACGRVPYSLFCCHRLFTFALQGFFVLTKLYQQ